MSQSRQTCVTQSRHQAAGVSAQGSIKDDAPHVEALHRLGQDRNGHTTIIAPGSNLAVKHFSVEIAIERKIVRAPRVQRTIAVDVGQHGLVVKVLIARVASALPNNGLLIRVKVQNRVSRIPKLDGVTVAQSWFQIGGEDEPGVGGIVYRHFKDTDRMEFGRGQVEQAYGNSTPQNLGLISNVIRSQDVGGNRPLGKPSSFSRGTRANDQAKFRQVSQVVNVPALDPDDVAWFGARDAGRVRESKGLADVTQPAQRDSAVGADEGHPVPGKSTVRRVDTYFIRIRIPGSSVGRTSPSDECVLVRCQSVERAIGPSSNDQQRQHQTDQNSQCSNPANLIFHKL